MSQPCQYRLAPMHQSNQHPQPPINQSYPYLRPEMYQFIPTQIAPPHVVPPPQPAIVQQPIVTNTVYEVTTLAIGTAPCSITRPICRQNITTQVKRSLKPDAWIWSAVLCVLSCGLCSWIPLLMDSNYKAEHF